MQDQFKRTEIILGLDSTRKLAQKRVAVFGIGGVGSCVVEALARSGIGALDLIDNDTYTITNLNRQLYATHQTLGQYKVDVAEKRIKEINPNCQVRVYKTFFLPQEESSFDFSQYDYVVDAIDTVAGKIGLVMASHQAKVPIISAMGAGNKIDPTAFEVADIYQTTVCPLAKVMRKELKERGIKHLKVVYSKEKPLKPEGLDDEQTSRRATPGSTPFVPPVVGFIMAGEVIKDLINK